MQPVKITTMNEPVMQLTSLAFSAREEVHWGSDIESVHFDADGLIVVIAREHVSDGGIQGLQVKFEKAAGFRYLDELEIARYWTSEGFISGHHVLEILEGGWSEEESAIQGYVTQRREWLVVTGNGCISIFSRFEPVIEPVVYVPI